MSDDVYMELIRLKGDKSFSEVIRSLLKKESNIEVLLIGFGTRNEEETEELRKKWRTLEIDAKLNFDEKSDRIAGSIFRNLKKKRKIPL